ncbi:MAG: M12 family metallo-peptidase [Acidobacteriota bacterium]
MMSNATVARRGDAMLPFVLGLLLASATALLVTGVAQAADVSIRFEASPQAVSEVRSLDLGGRLAVDNVPLGERRVSLELRRHRVWAPDARIVLKTEAGDEVLKTPQDTHFAGSVVGSPQSRATMTLAEDGTWRGIISTDGRWWLIGQTLNEVRLPSPQLREVVDEDVADRSFSCGASHLEHDHSVVEPAFNGALEVATMPESRGSLPTFTARIAVDSDNDFLDLFQGNTNDAIAYIGDVFSFSSSIYLDEVETSLEVVDVTLWSAPDPWTQNGTLCSLMEFGKYWNDNNDSISRTAAHFLSGANFGGGVAWVGVLCRNDFTVNLSDFGLNCPGLAVSSNYGGAYGVSADLDGNFDLSNPQIVWDVVVISHELGHNFDSPHTHCYNQASTAGTQPVDQCFNGEANNGCYGGSQSLPGPSGQGAGTLMSYCHLLSPGISNMGPTFGLGHPFGNDPDRVPEQMFAHVMAEANSNPGCLDPIIADLLFANGFEEGNTSAWD